MTNRKNSSRCFGRSSSPRGKMRGKMEDNICRNSRNQTRNERVKQYFKTGYVWCLWIYGNAFNSFFNRGRNNLVNISEEGISLIKKFEGCELRSYQDAVDVWTVGYGHTKDVKPGQMITKEEAEEMLIEELTEYCSYVETAVEVPLHQNQFDALVSWTYNLGPTNLNSSTMLKKLNAGEYEDIPEQIKRWNKAGGKVLPGLERRRLAESLLFEGKKWEHI
jgi:lysozyme